MNIYLDFEATQFKENIIAIGASCTYGEFDCLVKPPAGDKITNFITNLTGITKEMAYNALSIEEAFIDLWFWIHEMTQESETPVFYHVFGNMDKVFLKNAVKNIKSPYTREFVDNLAESLIDDSKQVCQYFHTKAIGVFKALKYFRPYYPEQNHDPLDDAIALRDLMSNILVAKPLEECPFEENRQIQKQYMIYAEKNNSIKKFNSLGLAAKWALEKIQKTNPEAVKKNVSNKIKKAITNETKYLDWSWSKKEV